MPSCTRETMFEDIKSRLDLGAKKMDKQDFKMNMLFILGLVGLAIEIGKMLWIK